MTFLWGRSRRKLEGSFPHVCFRPYGRKGIKGHLKMQNCNLLGWVRVHIDDLPITMIGF